MFSKLAIDVMKNNCLKYYYNQRRNLTWEVECQYNNKIGIDKDTISIYEGIRNIKFNENKNIRKGDILFEVKTDTNINNQFIADKDYVVVERNKNIMNTLNIDPENIEKSWILKICKSASYGTIIRENPFSSKIEKKHAIKSFLDVTKIVPYNYYNNSLDDAVIKKNKYINNSNEQDLIYYIQGNH